MARYATLTPKDSSFLLFRFWDQKLTVNTEWYFKVPPQIDLKMFENCVREALDSPRAAKLDFKPTDGFYCVNAEEKQVKKLRTADFAFIGAHPQSLYELYVKKCVWDSMCKAEFRP